MKKFTKWNYAENKGIVLRNWENDARMILVKNFGFPLKKYFKKNFLLCIAKSKFKKLIKILKNLYKDFLKNYI